MFLVLVTAVVLAALGYTLYECLGEWWDENH
jgi:hypothetical protein